MNNTKPYERNGLTYCYGANNERVCTGSQNGRRECIPSDFETVKKLRLVRVPMSSCGAYDKGGAYWGIGTPLYCAWGESETECAELFFRAKNRMEAKQAVLAEFPNARFFN